MKKIIFPILAVIIISATSCRKDRTCTCTTVSTSGGVSATSTDIQTRSASTKRVAKATTNCYSNKYTQASGNSSYEVVTTCKLS